MMRGPVSICLPTTPPVNVLRVQTSHQNQPASTQPEKTWFNAGIEQTKKDARLALLGSLGGGALPFFNVLGQQMDNKKILFSHWTRLLFFFASWGMAYTAMSFVKGVSENYFKTNPPPPPTSPIENGILAVRKSWPAYASFATILSLTMTHTLKKPAGMIPFLSAFWKKLRWMLPSILAGGSAIEFGIGAYQFGKPSKDKQA